MFIVVLTVLNGLTAYSAENSAALCANIVAFFGWIVISADAFKEYSSSKGL